MDNPIKTKKIGNYRISIYYDESALCPCTSWDMSACYLWNYGNRNSLSSECNWKDVFGEYANNQYSLTDALRQLVIDYVRWNDLFQYFKKGKIKDYKIRYDRSENLWYLGCTKNGVCDEVLSIEPSELREYEYTEEFIETLSNKELVQILNDLGTDIYVNGWNSCGYSQGNYVEGISYCTKERFEKMVDKNTTNWEKRIEPIINGEVKYIGMWIWGDVKGFTIEQKVPFTKVYDDPNKENEADFDWQEVTSCWGFFMETEELIEEVISEHQLKEAA